MAIPAPSLDNRTYADLVDEARALIPAFDPSWTNHNESDPGITLVELFAWLAEMQIFALDQITDEHRLTFLRLLQGPSLQAKRNADWTIDRDWLDQEIGKSLNSLRQWSRAVSAADHEWLALKASADVKRAQCVPRRNLEAGHEGLRQAVAPGHVSVVILPPRGASNPDALCKTVRDRIEPARTLTSRLHVVPPTYVPIATRIMVARRSDSPANALADRVKARLAEWLDPWTGRDGNGWPFGQNVYGSELNAVLDAISGVDYVGEATLESTPAADHPADHPAQPIWHDSGALVGFELAPHHLPRSPVEAHEVVVADRLDPVRVVVNVKPAAGRTAEATRAVTQALTDYLWSLQNGNRSFVLSASDIRNTLNNDHSVMAAVSLIADGAVVVEGPPARLSPTAAKPTYEFNPGEFFQATCQVEIAGANP